MRLLLLDEERVVLGVADTTGTLWEMTYNGMFNRSVIRVTASKAGYVAWMEVRDDTLTQTSTRMRWPDAACWLGVDDRADIAIGKFVYTPVVCRDDHEVNGVLTNTYSDLGAWEL